ncbi:MAG: ATP synthase F1 subunit delta [Gemmatimonadetes bacterium]|nr:ATP synthase F1 subunit delta [Gemmatimonadota bacterium]
MAGSAVATNYAEALFALGSKSGRLEEYGRLLEATAAALAASPEVQSVLVSPRVAKTAKSELVGRAIARIGAPREFVLYLQAVVKRGRQALFGDIAAAYGELVDRSLGRIRASVTLARTPDAAIESSIRSALATQLGTNVLPTFAVDAEILGGVVVRVGDRVYDGSVKRKLVRLKRSLLAR